jgi:GDPmannose 4,6-dehydratase
MKRAIIFGITGQDGSYLSEILLEKGYEVHGVIRRSATGNTINIDHLLENDNIIDKNLFIHRGDLSDPISIYRIILEVKPDEVYNEADQDHVSWSYDMVGYSADITASAPARILEIIYRSDKNIKYFQPCTSNMFGETEETPQNENTRFNPMSPYACAKASAYYFTRYYRKSLGLFASTAIMYNHESPRRTEEYVTRKISKTVARIHLGLAEKIELGDISPEIDWGYSKEYMEAAHSILQLDNPDDFIIATGEGHSVKEFLEEAFNFVGLDYMNYLKTNSKFFRPSKTSTLVGDISKAKKTFNFSPKIKFKELVQLMVEEDIKKLSAN